ncbi:type IV pilus assembly protein PilM [Candidatus Poribacteria bacterium]|nr:type IV pilus assembly protein PilM [Candidatus Poribacteria bacterium]
MSMFSKPEITLGLDIGSRFVKLVQLRHTNKNIELVNFGMEIIPPESIVDGTVMDFEPVIKVIQKLLKQFDIKSIDVNTTVEGKAVIVKKVKFPLISKTELIESIKFEAEQYVPFEMEEVNLDFQILTSNAETKSTDVLLVAVKKEKINNHLNLIRTAGLNPVIIDIDAFAVQNAFEASSTPLPEAVTALINIGCSITNINIVSNGIPLFTRDITMGGNNFTKTLQKELLLNFEEAEQLKINYGKENKPEKNVNVLDSTIDYDVKEIMNSIMNELAIEILHSFEYYNTSSEGKKITNVVLSGGTAKTYGLAEFLSQKLNLKTDIHNPFKNISIDENKFSIKSLESIAPIFSVGVGLGLRNLKNEAEK